MNMNKTPDKIYLWETPIVNGGYDPAWHKNSFNEGDVEYIRKDALIEKISELRAIPHDNAIARDNAFVEIINIINSIK